MNIAVVDVFAEERFAGNQLAVVHDAGGLDTEEMQRIALEMNFSETTFVTSFEKGASEAAVRIFTPHKEIPFAGHPTLGTAWVLGRERESFTLDLAVGAVTMTFDRDSGIAWMRPPEPSFEAGLERARAADSLGLSLDEISVEWPRRLADIGPCFHFIAVESLDALARATVSAEDFAGLFPDPAKVGGVFIFCSKETHSPEADFAARMFFESGGVVREDPATGSASSAFAALLRDHLGGPVSAVVDQGVEMGRPSRLYLEVDADGIRVGGKVQPVLEGEFS